MEHSPSAREQSLDPSPADAATSRLRARERANLLEDAAQTITLHLKVVAPLQVHPETLRGPEVAGQPQRSVRANPSRAVHDLVDTARRHADRDRKPVLGDAQRPEVLLVEDLPGVDR